MDMNVAIKGGAKLALGVSVWGIVMALDTMDLIPSDGYGKATKYAGLIAGALYAGSGALIVINGRD